MKETASNAAARILPTLLFLLLPAFLLQAQSRPAQDAPQALKDKISKERNFRNQAGPAPLTKGLIVDLNADSGVVARDDKRVEKWLNQADPFPVKVFEKTNEGRKVKDSGMPLLRTAVPELNGHNAIVFNKQELLAAGEDDFDHLITGTGYTWFCVLKAGNQAGGLEDVNSFFGNLRNGGNYEGFWGGLTDSNQVWMGSRSGKTFGRWDVNNPCVLSDQVLQPDRYYLLIGRMEEGTGEVELSLYINNAKKPAAIHPFPVNSSADASMLAIGQERDAVNHPGVESFVGEIARFLLYERPLSRKEMTRMARNLVSHYSIKTTP